MNEPKIVPGSVRFTAYQQGEQLAEALRDEIRAVAKQQTDGVDRLADENRRLRAALTWIAAQPCARRPKSGKGRWTRCRDTRDCATEWCLPCYAAQALAPPPEEHP